MLEDTKEEKNYFNGFKSKVNHAQREENGVFGRGVNKMKGQ